MKNLLFAGTAALCLISTAAAAQDKELDEINKTAFEAIDANKDAFTAPAPVILINVFTVPTGKEAEALAFWDKAGKFLKTQPGYISTALHKAILPNAKYGLVNVAKWESAEAFNKATVKMRSKSGIKPINGLKFDASLYFVVRSD